MNRLAIPSLVLFVAVLSTDAFAQTCTTSWANPVDGAWTDAMAWTAGVPNGSSTACITADGTYTVATGTGNVVVSGLVVGGNSGTQTLATNNVFDISGDGSVGVNARWEVLNRTPGGGDGIYVGGTLLIQGVLTQEVGTTMLDGAGVLEIAEGGRWVLLSGASAGVVSRPAEYRVNGSLEGDCTSICNINIPLHSDAGTIRVVVGELRLNQGGSLHDTVVDVPEGTTLRFDDGGGQLEITGTLSGEPQGTVIMSGVGSLLVGPGDATFSLGGNGLRLDGSSGLASTLMYSAGGAIINTGRLVWGRFTYAHGLVIENRGELEVTSTVSLREGSVLRNVPGGIVRILGGGFAVTNGRFENAGLLVREGEVGSSGLGGLLRSLPGSEIRSNADRLDLAEPAAYTAPRGVTITGTGRFLVPRALEFEGTISPGTEEQPLAGLEFQSAFIPSQVAGSPQLVIDVGTGGQSDTLIVFHSSGAPNVRLAGALIVRVRPDYTPNIGDEFTVLTNGREILGQFSQVVSEGAPDGIAFIAEIAEDQQSVVVRAVESAPGGAILISNATPIGGDVRSIFLTGPGAVGVSAARLECTNCLDADDFGSIPAELVGAGTLREARFDLTSPRIFGSYDLVLSQPSLPDSAVAVTVRPFLGYVVGDGGLARGGRVRPPGQGYNYSYYRMRVRTNVDAPSFSLPRVFRQDSTLFALALATTNPFSNGHVVLETDDAADPSRAPLMFGRIPQGEPTNLTFGLRINPENVLFPEQEPDGPDDPRIPFGDPRGFSAAGVQHFSYARALSTIGDALRTSGNAALTNYVASVDAADPIAIETAFNSSVVSRKSYFTIPRDVLRAFIDVLNETVAAPAGLADDAAEAFALALERTAFTLYAEVEAAHVEALTASSPEVAELFDTESRALFPEGFPAELSAQKFPGLSALAPSAFASTAKQQGLGSWLWCKLGYGDSVDVINGQTDPYAAYDASSGGGAGGGGGGSCGPPEGSADPNDKLAESELMCEFGTVVVGGVEETRCIRYYIPRERAADPIVYTIKFENLPQATAPAEFVTVTDEIDNNLNLASLQILGTSSDSTFSYTVEGRTITFRFIGINLPPNVTAPEGEGYVQFTLRPNAALPDSTEIRNDASIVFDFNPPIETPEVVHQIRELSDLATAIEAADFAESGQPFAFTVYAVNLRGDDATNAALTISTSAQVVSATASSGECTGTGPIVCEFETLATTGGGGLPVESVTVVVQPDQPGELTVDAEIFAPVSDGFAANNKDSRALMVTPVGTEDLADVSGAFRLEQSSPNPTSGPTRIAYTLPSAAYVQVEVFDLLGRRVAQIVDADQPVGSHEVTWQADVAAGVYVYRLRAERADGGVDTDAKKIMVVR